MLSLSLEKFVAPVLRAVAAVGTPPGPVLPVSMPSSPATSPPVSPSGMQDARLPADRWSAPMEAGAAPRSVYVKVAGAW